MLTRASDVVLRLRPPLPFPHSHGPEQALVGKGGLPKQRNPARESSVPGAREWSPPVKELRQRMIEDLRIRNLSESTQETYIRQVAAFARYFGRSPAELGPEHIRSWQVHLVKRGMSWSSLNIAVCALRFLYGITLGRDWTVKFIPYAKKEKALPVVLSTAEVKSLLDVLTNLKHRAMLMVAYSGGLRVSEIAGLRLEDIDSKRMVIHVRKGKGRKDRFVPLSPKLLDELRVYWRASRPRPFLFPGSDPHRPITPGSIALVCKSATRRAGLKKRVSPHTLRHAFATHHLEAGTDVRTIQMLLGHGSIRTTCCYMHISREKISSIPTPLDLLPDTSTP